MPTAGNKSRDASPPTTWKRIKGVTRVNVAYDSGIITVGPRADTHSFMMLTETLFFRREITLY
jgi:hypothetical protein